MKLLLKLSTDAYSVCVLRSSAFLEKAAFEPRKALSYRISLGDFYITA
jgi:hypothetical protein